MPDVKSLLPYSVRNLLRRVKARYNAFHSPMRAYLLCDDIERVVKKLEKVAKHKRLDTSPDREFWFSYTSALLEMGCREKASRVMAWYRDRYGNVDGAASYLRVANLVVECSMAESHELMSAKKAYDLISTIDSRGVMSDFFKGKSVAIVGNGPREQGRGLGAEIDGHDIVVRFNNIDLAGYEQDYGRRTDVWVKHMQKTLRHHLDDPSLKMVVYESHLLRFPLVSGYADAIIKDAEARSIAYCDSAHHAFFTRRYNLYPTSGILLIEMIRHLPVKYLDVYGFSFLDQVKISSYSHYSSRRSVQEKTADIGWHDMNVEASYLRKLFKNGRRLECEPSAN